jgi:hypothetical protein
MLPAAERTRLGAWYTPDALVQHVVERTITAALVARCASARHPVRVLDPACGDGRFLVAAAQRVRELGGAVELNGADIDLAGLRSVVALGEQIDAVEADSLHHDWGDRRFDAVVGNPPFLTQMATATVRPAGSRFGGGPYADAAADFLALSVERLAVGGRAGLVLPISLLTARDAGPIRQRVAAVAPIDWFWWSDTPMFDAGVRTCAIGVERADGPLLPVRRSASARPDPAGQAQLDLDHAGGRALEIPRDVIRRTHGPGFELVGSVPFDSMSRQWGGLIADSLGVPPLAQLLADGVTADHALVTANFRDQYYGLVGSVRDDGDGPPLITTGLIDPGVCHWGTRPTRFAKQTFAAPRVDRSALAPFMQRWADRCLVPKVLLATQTRVLEAVVDEAGAWLPAVPVVRLVPSDPVPSAFVAGQSAGSGLSASTVRVSQRIVGAVPWPAGDLAEAAAALRAGDIEACGVAVTAAYGIGGEPADALVDWWRAGLPLAR